MKGKARAANRKPTGRARTAGRRAPHASTLSSSALVLPAQLDIRTLGAVAADLRERVALDRALALDGSAVTGIDTAALQLLLAARRAAEARGLTFEWRNASESLRSTSRLLGLCAALRLA